MTNERSHLFSRRGFCLCCLSATTFTATGGWLTPGQAFSAARGIVDLIKDDAATAQIKVSPICEGAYVLEGSGGNVAVLTGRDGKLLIDAGIAVSRPQMERALASVGEAPVTRLINTHWHFDHADGNSWLHQMRPTITAHANARKHLAVVQRVDDWSYDFAPLSEAALPTDLFTSEHSVPFSGLVVDMSYYGPAHTDSDISVAIPQLDILHTGDSFWNGSYPFIDYSTGGSIDGSIKAAETNLKATTNKTIVIPGHGTPIANRSDLQAFRDMLVTIRDNVAGLKQQGRSLDETVAAQPTAAFDAKWGRFVISPALFTKLVYQGV